MVKDIVAESTAALGVRDFVPRLARFLAVEHGPHKRRFLIDWVTLLGSVPDLDLLPYLPQLLAGLLAMLSDPHTEIRIAVTRALEDFLTQVWRARLCGFASFQFQFLSLKCCAPSCAALRSPRLAAGGRAPRCGGLPRADGHPGGQHAEPQRRGAAHRHALAARLPAGAGRG